MHCSFVAVDEKECGAVAAFSFLVRDGEHLEICALHFSAAWLQGVFSNFGSIHDMVVCGVPCEGDPSCPPCIVAGICLDPAPHREFPA